MNRQALEYLVVGTLLLAVGMAQLLVLAPGHPWGGDFSQYIHHSLNLLQGRPYGDTGYLFNPAHPDVGPPMYPPGLPVLLVPPIAVWGVHFTILKLVMLCSSLAFVAMVYLCFRRELPFAYVAALLAVVGLNQYALADVNSIGSDVPFMALLYLAIFVIRAAYNTPSEQPPRLGLLVLAALLMYGCYATRTIGVVLLPSLLAYDLIRYRRITRWAVTAGSLFVALAFAQSHFLQSATGYLDEYRGVGPGLFVHHAYLYATKFAAYWHNGYSPALAVALFAVIAALAMLGYGTNLRREVTLFEIFPVLYLGAVLAFPGYQGMRYLIPVMPFVVLFAFRGLQHPWLQARPRRRRLVAGTLIIAIGGSYLAAYTSLRAGSREGIAKPESVALFDFVRQQTDPDDVIVFVKPRVMALLTQRDSSTFHTPADDRELWEYFGRIGATHLVEVVNDAAFENYEPLPRLAWLRRFVERSGGRLQRVFENRDFRVYRIAPQVPEAYAQKAG